MIIFRYHTTHRTLSLEGRWKHWVATALRIFFVLSMLSLQVSCGGSKVHKEIGLKKTDLNSISRVAIIATSNTPEVYYPEYLTPGGLAFLLVLSVVNPLLGPIIAGLATGTSSERTEQIGGSTDPIIINDVVVNGFLSSLGKNGSLKKVEYVKGQDEERLFDGGYDGIIQLTVSKISFNRVAEDRLRLYVNVRGTMKSLGSKNILWDREEIVTPRDTQSVEYYKENAMKDLRSLLEKAGRNLAYDFLYLQ